MHNRGLDGYIPFMSISMDSLSSNYIDIGGTNMS